ncbi:hypothetical protein OK351_12020 [Glutamicibacter sp. MNS18]|uniref:hypothetical protein n=1 Tax=Glutamicibacter sp. MNS18 TaxID=2989817 RepID=UPI00223572EF|nr:hypothetical protein [Glutamicibacter sp. MNS18]MCW4466224.1 hypothetical protein [Glutamicibacter sp. MNS18]
MMKKKTLTAAALAVPLALALTGCGISSAFDDRYEDSASKSAKTSQDGVASGLLPGWVPAGGSDIRLEQRSTGHERIFVMDYAGELPAGQCTKIKEEGAPSAAELEAAYGGDPRTKDIDPEEFVTFRTLEADWWPDATEQRTTHLCGRWWVHQQQGNLYAFAPDISGVATKVVQERAENQ